MAKKTNDKPPNAIIWLGLDLVVIAATVAIALFALQPAFQRYRAKLLSKERAQALAGLTKELDRRYFKKKHYNPTGPKDDVWYGFSPETFPPGQVDEWVSDARWNQISYRAKDGSTYRYGLCTLGEEAWLMAYGDADQDGVHSRIYRHFSGGRMLQEWRVRPSE